MLLEWFFLLVLILLNGVFAMAEMAIVSVRQARLRHQAHAGSPSAMAALRLAQEPNDFLSTVQVGITLVATLAGAFSGSTIARHLEPYVREIDLFAAHSQSASLAIVVFIITYLSLVIGELLPKRLALLHAEGIALTVAIPMRGLSWLLTPIVRILSWSTEGLLWLLGVRNSQESPVTPEEISSLMAQGTEAGVFDAAEHSMVENALLLNRMTVTEMMTPRPDLVWLSMDAPIEQNFETMRQHRRSWYPVMEGEVLDPVGMIAVKDIWASSLNGDSVHLRQLMRPPLLIPEKATVLEALGSMKKNHARVAIIVDEYLHTQGMVSLTDILQTLVDDLEPLFAGSNRGGVTQRDDGSWLVDGIIPIEEFNERFEVALDADEKHRKAQYQTLGGFIMTQLGHIPSAGDHFQWQHLRFEVVDMDGARVDKVLVSQQELA